MLILSRKTGESVYIGDDIRVVVLKATSQGVRLGFDAPPELGIHREEVYARLVDTLATQSRG